MHALPEDRLAAPLSEHRYSGPSELEKTLISTIKKVGLILILTIAGIPTVAIVLVILHAFPILLAAPLTVIGVVFAISLLSQI